MIERPSPVVILAPHGGTIEPATSTIATAIAADRYSLYCFDGLKPRPHGDLHITSGRFDEPRALALVARSSIAVAVHGYLGQTPSEPVLIGGLDAPLIEIIAAGLAGAGFSTLAADHRFQGTDPANICNRTNRRAGVQLELPRNLRDRLRDDASMLEAFADTVSRGIEAHLAATP